MPGGRQAGRQARGAGKEGGRDTILMVAARREGQTRDANPPQSIRHHHHTLDNTIGISARARTRIKKYD